MTRLYPKEVFIFLCLVQCRLICQCAVQPGLGKVYSQILLQTHTSAEFYLKVSASSDYLTSHMTHDTGAGVATYRRPPDVPSMADGISSWLPP